MFFGNYVMSLTLALTIRRLKALSYCFFGIISAWTWVICLRSFLSFLTYRELGYILSKFFFFCICPRSWGITISYLAGISKLLSLVSTFDRKFRCLIFQCVIIRIILTWSRRIYSLLGLYSASH